MPTELADRGILRVTGPEGRGFLDRLVTCDLDRVSPDRPRYGALLTPQGKILADFVVAEAPGTDGPEFYIDCPSSVAGELARRLTLYKLRAKVSLSDLSPQVAVVAGWGADALPSASIWSGRDPRLAALGWRALLPRSGMPAGADEDEREYEAHRIALGIPAAGLDFTLGDAFPHEALMDQLGGVDFDKGCYIGQEVVSRMQHRGTARSRVVALTYESDPPAWGAEVLAGDRAIGRMGSAAEGRALALIRLDRATDGLATGAAITAAGRPLRFAKPEWVRFTYPGDAVAAA